MDHCIHVPISWNKDVAVSKVSIVRQSSLKLKIGLRLGLVPLSEDSRSDEGQSVGKVAKANN